MSRSRLAACVLALLTAGSIWLSAAIQFGGDTTRIAAFPPLWLLLILAAAAPAAAWLLRFDLAHAWPLAISLFLWLPYLPFQVPSPFLIWEGPIEGVVWLCVIAGLIAARPPRMPAALSNPRLAPWLAAALVGTLALAAFSQVRNVIPGGDEPHYLAATQSLLHDFDLRVANNYQRGEYLEYFPGRLEPHFLKRSTSGEIYSIHAPGVSAIVLPAFAIAGYSGAVWTMILVAAVTAGLAWRLAFAVASSASAAWVAVVAVFLSAPYFFHTFTIYPEVIGGLCVLAGVWLLMEMAKGREPGAFALVAVGTLLALLPWLHSRFAVLAAVIGFLIVARLIASTRVATKVPMFLFVPAVAAAGWFAFFYVIWGSASPTAPYGADTSTSVSYVLRGLIGLLVDQQFDVLTTAPVHALTAIGFVMLSRAEPRLATELILIAVPYAVAVASYAMWWAGAAAPARFLVAILPLAVVPLAFGIARSQVCRIAALILAAVSVALIVPRALEDSGRFIYNNRSGIDATLRWLTSSVDLPAALPSVHRTGGSIAVRDAMVWLAGLAAVLGFVAAVARNWTTGARFTLMTALLAAAAMMSARVAWSMDHFTPIDAHRARLSMLDRFRPSWHSTIVELPSRAALSTDAMLARLPIVMQGSAMVLERVPAGEYAVSAIPTVATTGSMRIYLGRNDGPLAQPSLDDLRDSQRPFVLRLPVMARALNLRIEGGVDNDAEVTLQPVGTVATASRRPATRAARFGQARAFFFDERAYPERDGFWTRANGEAEVVIDTDHGGQSGLPLSVTAGAVPTTITLATSGWKKTLTLTAGQKQDVVVPATASGAWPLRIRSGAGFRPSEREPGSTDVRALSAWIAIR